ncbi:hypothetical protein PybrP1_001035 [[Pythium] brassicae (nom. inval.)]|nr:hypothetical protein PybrP1_001035 [[Pythium] brassicae (nom. inval.)]
MKNLRAAALALMIALATSATAAVEASTTHVRVRVHAAAAVTASNATDKPSLALSNPVNRGVAVGQWTNLESNNYSIADPCKPQEWTVKQAKAAALQLHFASINLAGHKLIVSAPNGSFAQEFSSESALHNVTTKTIPGSTAKISFQPSALNTRTSAGVAVAGSCDSKLMRPSFTLDKVSAFWSQQMKVKKEAICGKNTVKNPTCLGGDMYAKSKAVMHLMQGAADGKIYVCTAWLWGNIGYIITNNHCIQDSTELLSATFEFQEDIGCDDDYSFHNCKFDGALIGFMDLRFVKTSTVHDYSLLMIRNPRLANQIVQKYGYLKLQRAPVKVGDQIYIPQHPNGNAKKIASTDDDSDTSVAKIIAVGASASDGTTTFGGLVQYAADTDHGSSGSPVISRTSNAVVGLHRLAGNCANSGTSADSLISELDMFLPGIDGIQG